MRTGYTGLDSKARKIKKMYVGVNNIARKITREYVGVNGVATLVYPMDQPIPTVSGSYTYNREVFEAVISEIDEDMVSMSGVTKTQEAGTYTVTFTLKSENYRWEDGTNTPKTGTWSIAKKSLEKPHIIPGSYTYNGSIQAVAITQYDPFGVSISGNMELNAGAHTVTFALADTNNYQWSDGTTAPYSEDWYISPLYVAIPTVSGSYTYAAKSFSPTITYASGTQSLITQTGTASATVAGSYKVYFNLKDKNNYRWDDTNKTTAQKEGSWSIAKASVTVPTLSATSKVYSGSAQSVTVSGFDSKTMVQNSSSVLSATVVGTYTVRIDLKDSANYKWASGDANIAYRNLTWQITKKPVTIPTVSANPTYNDGKDVSPTLANFDSKYMTKKNDVKQLAGDYTIYFNLIDSKNTQWDGGSVSQQSRAWKVLKANVLIPYVVSNPTYNGTDQSPTLANYDSKTVKLSDNLQTDRKESGNYTIYFNLIDSANHQWTDGKITQKSDSWNINKGTLVIAFSPDPLTIRCSNYNDYYWNGTGILRATIKIGNTLIDNIPQENLTVEASFSGKEMIMTYSGTYSNGNIDMSVRTMLDKEHNSAHGSIKISVKETKNYYAGSKSCGVTALSPYA